MLRWFRKFYAIIFFFISFIIFIALTSYDINDSSFNVVASSPPNNLLSYFGANLADLLYQSLGAGAFAITFVVFIVSLLLFFYGEINYYILKSFIVIIAISGLATSLNSFTCQLPSGCGGSIGKLLHRLIDGYGYTADVILFIISLTTILLAIDPSGRSYKIILRTISKVASIIRKCISYAEFNQYNKKVGIAPVLNISPKESYNNNSPYEQKEEAPNKIAISKKSIVQYSQQQQITTLPSVELLTIPSVKQTKLYSDSELEENANNLLTVLSDFGVKGKVIGINQGPVVTLYELEPAAGTKSSRVIGLADDIARSLCALSTRIATIPGRNALGIELPNKQRAFFCLRELIETPEYQDTTLSLPLILGKDLAGRPLIADLAKMPHLLVAGTTGSGKSVAINTMIMSLLYKYSPADCRLIMIDPKMLELSVYDNIPHLLTPVVTESAKAVTALKWAVKEMENRYRLMSNIGVRNINGYNVKIAEAIKEGKELVRTAHTGFDNETGSPVYESVPISMEKLPFIVVIVDEMADLMMVAGKDIETSIQRLAQMARAAGIHIIMATQRPSVDVITGVIKANFPSRISFKVTSKIDSRTILGEQGAEQLLGMGDMLYMGSSARIMRVHGPFIDDNEVEKVSEFLRTTGTPDYVSAVTQVIEEDMDGEPLENGNNEDNLYQQALAIVKNERKTSISYIQRSLRIGYNRAADLVDKMERNGVLSPANHSGKRTILIEE